MSSQNIVCLKCALTYYNMRIVNYILMSPFLRLPWIYRASIGNQFMQIWQVYIYCTQCEEYCGTSNMLNQITFA
jgi:hypothetical protein